MSEFNLFVSQHDLQVLKEFVHFTRKHCNVQFKLHDGYNFLAKSMGYPSWNALTKFNKHEVLFSDVFQILKMSAPDFIEFLADNAGLKLKKGSANSISESLLTRFTPTNQQWLSLAGAGESANKNEIKLCLLPTDNENKFRLISYKNLLELFNRLTSDTEKLSLHFEPIIHVEPSKVFSRKRPYKSELPIFKYLSESLDSAVFVETNNIVISHFPCIKSEDLDITEQQLRTVLIRATFFCECSYFYTYKTKKNLFVLYAHNDNEQKLIGTKAADREEILKFNASRPNGVHFPSELLFQINLLRHIPPVDVRDNYFEYCNKSMCNYHDLNYVS